MQRTLTLALSAIAMLLAACSSSHQGNEAEKAQTQDTAKAETFAFRGDTAARRRGMRSEVPARACRVVATVVAIDPTPHSNDPRHLAARYPSVATIRIDSVVLKGAAFTQPFSPGESATVTFAPTLSPTRVVDPHAKREYPGLAVGSRFEANVVLRDVPADKAGAEFQTTPLVIYDYQAL